MFGKIRNAYYHKVLHEREMNWDLPLGKEYHDNFESLIVLFPEVGMMNSVEAKLFLEIIWGYFQVETKVYRMPDYLILDFVYLIYCWQTQKKFSFFKTYALWVKLDVIKDLSKVVFFYSTAIITAILLFKIVSSF